MKKKAIILPEEAANSKIDDGTNEVVLTKLFQFDEEMKQEKLNLPKIIEICTQMIKEIPNTSYFIYSQYFIPTVLNYFTLIIPQLDVITGYKPIELLKNISSCEGDAAKIFFSSGISLMVLNLAKSNKNTHLSKLSLETFSSYLEQLPRDHILEDPQEIVNTTLELSVSDCMPLTYQILEELFSHLNINAILEDILCAFAILMYHDSAINSILLLSNHWIPINQEIAAVFDDLGITNYLTAKLPLYKPAIRANVYLLLSKFIDNHCNSQIVLDNLEQNLEFFRSNLYSASSPELPELLIFAKSLISVGAEIIRDLPIFVLNNLEEYTFQAKISAYLFLSEALKNFDFGWNGLAVEDLDDKFISCIENGLDLLENERNSEVTQSLLQIINHLINKSCFNDKIRELMTESDVTDLLQSIVIEGNTDVIPLAKNIIDFVSN